MEDDRYTEDHVFLLSLDEAESVDENIRAVGSRWWLRSPRSRQSFILDKIPTVLEDGSLFYKHEAQLAQENCELGVRPALTIDLSKISE